MPPSPTQGLGCQGQVCGCLVVTQGIQTALEVMLVPRPGQERRSCGWVPTPARNKTWCFTWPVQPPFEQVPPTVLLLQREILSPKLAALPVPELELES